MCEFGRGYWNLCWNNNERNRDPHFPVECGFYSENSCLACLKEVGIKEHRRKIEGDLPKLEASQIKKNMESNRQMMHRPALPPGPKMTRDHGLRISVIGEASAVSTSPVDGCKRGRGTPA